MEKKILISAVGASAAAALVSLLIDWRISAGLIVGILSFLMYYAVLYVDISEQLKSKESKRKILTIIAKTVRLLLLIFPLFIAYLFPEYVSFWGVAAGLLMFKICLYGYTIVKGSKEG